MKGCKGQLSSYIILSSCDTSMITDNIITQASDEVRPAQLPPSLLETAVGREAGIPEEAGTALTAVSLLILLLWGVKGLIQEVTKLVEVCKED